ncbi:MAG: sensor histidine kinase [Acidobacteria bacterium]|nr:sensor histidine kinase [Acidobacteriota bacterium]
MRRCAPQRNGRGGLVSALGIAPRGTAAQDGVIIPADRFSVNDVTAQTRATPGRTALYTGAAVALGLLSGAGSYATSAMQNEAARLFPMLAWSVAAWLVWLLLVPGIVEVTRRLPLRSPGAARNTVLHTLAMIGFVLLHELLYVGLIVAFEPQILTDPGVGLVLTARLGGYAVLGALVYVGVVAVEHLVATNERARRREIEAARLETELAEARLQSLATQLQPHFLFNTLNTATGLLREDRNEAAADVLVHLGDLLRDSLGDRPTLVTVADERDTIERYLAIQRARFGGRIDIELDFDDDALGGLLPHFVLQPLVENAFRHGVGETSQRGTVTVRARREKSQLCLEVHDTGPGFHADAEDGTGLRSTRARLRQAYGDDWQLGPMEADGALVRMVLPYRSELNS